MSEQITTMTNNMEASCPKPPERDNRELQATKRTALLNTLITQGIANLAPLLSLGRVPQPHELEGTTATLRVNKVKSISSEGITLICMHSRLKWANATNTEENSNYTLYTFRGISDLAFEPFICLAKLENKWLIFAYANDNEFLLEEKTLDCVDLINTIQVKAQKMGYNALARYIDIIQTLLNDKGGEMNL